ncbi:MAG TPA: hypothetical protein VEL47_00190 [Myxococcota bacterium]|nr:hypothetical protein [Myxococcota bacterium]
MSLDSIVHITIDTKSLQMAQAGFGIPLIIVQENELTNGRVQIFKDLSSLQVKNTQSTLYRMAHLMLAQNPRIRFGKIGVRLKSETIETALSAIVNEDADFYGILLANHHGENHAAYMKDIGSLAEAISSKRYLAGVDITDKHLDVVQELKAKGYSNIFCAYQTLAEESLSAAFIRKQN